MSYPLVKRRLRPLVTEASPAGLTHRVLCVGLLSEQVWDLGLSTALPGLAPVPRGASGSRGRGVSGEAFPF